MKYQKIMRNILKQHPDLSGHGWRDGGMSQSEFQTDRDWMLTREALDQFAHACKWVSLMKPIKTINNRPTSYGLMHMAESYKNTYIANGVLIAAALHYGYFYKRYGKDDPNCFFNMSSRLII
jgi:hypothetical protein